MILAGSERGQHTIEKMWKEAEEVPFSEEGWRPWNDWGVNHSSWWDTNIDSYGPLPMLDDQQWEQQCDPNVELSMWLSRG